MKLRVNGNSIRFRLNKVDVEQFAEKGNVEEHVSFGFNGQPDFVYSIEKTKTGNPNTSFEGGKMSIQVPPGVAEKWIKTDQVGFEFIINSDSKSPPLKVLVEKDFACLKPRAGKDDANTFPNPESGKIC